MEKPSGGYSGWWSGVVEEGVGVAGKRKTRLKVFPCHDVMSNTFTLMLLLRKELFKKHPVVEAMKSCPRKHKEKFHTRIQLLLEIFLLPFLS